MNNFEEITAGSPKAIPPTGTKLKIQKAKIKTQNSKEREVKRKKRNLKRGKKKARG